MELKDQLQATLLESVNDAFTTTLSLPVSQTDENILPCEEHGLISSIGLTGLIDGNLSICISRTDATKIVSTMLCMDIDPDSPDVADGLGEVTNLIIGGIKNKMATQYQVNFNISIPSTISGSHLNMSGSESLIQFLKFFICEDIKFSMLLSYKLHEESTDQMKQPNLNALSALEKLKQAAQNNTPKPNPLDILNQAVKKTEEIKPNPLDILNQAINNNNEKEK